MTADRGPASAAVGQPTACFFARVSDPTHIRTIEFYAQDVRFLAELGDRIRVTTRVRDLFRQRPAALYFCWWWTWAAFPVLLARLLRRPAIVTGVFNYDRFDRRPWHQRVLIRFAARRASASLFDSHLELGAVTAMMPVSRPRFSPHTVDTAVYAPLTGGRRDPDLLVTVALLDGGNSVRKCVAESIRAFARLAPARPRLRLVVAGERGSDYPSLARLASDLGVADRVSFPGRVTLDEKVRLMQTCAIYLQPSRFEGFGLAGLEAMATGAAVLTSPVGAVTEVGADTVSYVDGTDVPALAAATERLLDDADLRSALGEAARARAVEYFSPARRRADIRSLLRELGAPC